MNNIMGTSLEIKRRDAYTLIPLKIFQNMHRNIQLISNRRSRSFNDTELILVYLKTKFVV
jgi:hypothetical protein